MRILASDQELPAPALSEPGNNEEDQNSGLFDSCKTAQGPLAHHGMGATTLFANQIGQAQGRGVFCQFLPSGGILLEQVHVEFFLGPNLSGQPNRLHPGGMGLHKAPVPAAGFFLEAGRTYD